MMSKIDLEKQMDELLDESLQAVLETEKFALREKISQLYEELNRNDKHKEKNPFYLKDYSECASTISCVELTMRHDKRGHIIDWMEGEHTSGECTRS